MPSPSAHILIAGLGSISPLGANPTQTSARYTSPPRHAFRPIPFAQGESWAAPICPEAEQAIANLCQERPAYRELDRTVLFAIHAARQAIADANWTGTTPATGVCIGSSRGATALWEEFHQYHLEHPTDRLPILASPTTTLGNLSSWVAEDARIGEHGITTELSVTCSSALHAIATAIAYLRAGMATRFLAGATEAPLTSFTLAQMQALRLVSTDPNAEWPCRPCAAQPQNTLTLGEGAAILALEAVPNSVAHASRPCPTRPRIAALGLAREPLTTNTGISREGQALAAAMRSARDQFPHPIDALILHAPGTALGDEPELRAIRAIFEDHQPLLLSNKHLLGHTLGAAGALSIELALHVLRTQSIPTFPYPTRITNPTASTPIRTIMINATGFGGNAASLIITADSF